MKNVTKTINGTNIDTASLKTSISCKPNPYVLTLKRMPPKI